MSGQSLPLHHRFDGREDAPPDTPVVLLSNSLGTSLEMWDAQAEPLARHFRLLRYDGRGHGRSPVPPGPYAIEDLGRDALGLLDRLGLARVAFVGISMGGMVGMWLALNAPDRLSALAVANTSARIGGREMWDRRIETVRREGMAAIADAVVERWFTAPFRAAAPQAAETIRRQLLATEPACYAASCAAVRDVDLLDALGAIRTPTLVLAGEHDTATPPDHAEAIARAIPDARLALLPAAHLSNIEAAARFNTEVLAHLTAHTD